MAAGARSSSKRASSKVLKEVEEEEDVKEPVKRVRTCAAGPAYKGVEKIKHDRFEALLENLHESKDTIKEAREHAEDCYKQSQQAYEDYMAAKDAYDEAALSVLTFHKPGLERRCIRVVSALVQEYQYQTYLFAAGGAFTPRDSELDRQTSSGAPCEFCTKAGGAHPIHIWLQPSPEGIRLNCSRARSEKDEGLMVTSSVQCFSTHSCNKCFAVLLVYLQREKALPSGWSSFCPIPPTELDKLVSDLLLMETYCQD